MKIGVVGLGFVGLTTALGFAEKGINTLGYDLDLAKLHQINENKIPFYEPELSNALKRQLGNNFNVTDNISNLVKNSSIIFICVGTPKGIDGSADLTQIKSVLKEILNQLDDIDSKIVLIKSTIPPTTIDQLYKYVYEVNHNKKANISLGANPEFLREGHAWHDFMYPDKIIVGYEGKEEDKTKISEIYKSFKVGVTFTNPKTAEFSKYLSNALLSTLVSFSNEMSLIANKIGGIKVEGAFKLLHLDSRFYGNPAGIISYIYPGCGYGGYCLPKDTQAIASLAKNLGFSPLLMEANIEINESIMGFWMNELMKENPNRDVSIGILGLSFKPESDDVRDTPAAKCINILKEKGYYNVRVYDPMAQENFSKTYPELKVTYVASSKELVGSSDVVIILTAWDEFKEIDYSNKRLFNLRYIPIPN